MRFGLLGVALLVLAGCASDPVVVSNEPGKYGSAREVFVQDAVKMGVPQERAECAAGEIERRLDPVVLSRMNAAARGDIELTESEYEQIETANSIRLHNEWPAIKAVCGA